MNWFQFFALCSVIYAANRSGETSSLVFSVIYLFFAVFALYGDHKK